MNNPKILDITYRLILPIASILIVVFFVSQFADLSFILSIQGLCAFLIYSLLSLITGLRYINFVGAITKKSPPASLSITLPASMNLMSFVLPFKGGGIWLIFYLRQFHGIGVFKSSWLALVNSIMAACLIIAMIGFPPTVDRGGYSLPLMVFMTTYFAIVLCALYVYNKTSALDRTIGVRRALLDTALSIVYILVLYSLVVIVVPDGTFHLQVGLVVLTISSMAVKVTPGNVGIFEGLALLLMSIFPETGDRFVEYVATYRVLSLSHAIFFGLPSVLYLTDLRNMRRLLAGADSAARQ